MFSTIPVAFALLAVAVSGQTTSANSTIDPSSVDLTLRNQWCSAQMNTCGTLCSGSASPNTCDGTTLDFNCTCTANSSAPALALYTETMPTFICEQIYADCIAANENVAAAQAKCTAAEVANCGHLDPENFVAPATTTSSAATTSASATGTGTAASGTGSASSSTSTGAAATMVAIGGQYGSGLMLAGAAAAFGLIL